MSLEPVPEDWSRALAVVAHPDDLEYGAASAIARWTDQGKWVGYVLATSGEAGHRRAWRPTRPPACARTRSGARPRSWASTRVEFLAHPDGLVEPSIALRRDLARRSAATAPRC